MMDVFLLFINVLELFGYIAFQKTLTSPFKQNAHYAP